MTKVVSLTAYLCFIIASICNSTFGGIHENIAQIHIDFPGGDNEQLRRLLIKKEYAIVKDSRQMLVHKYAVVRQKSRAKRIEQRRQPRNIYRWYSRPNYNGSYGYGGYNGYGYGGYGYGGYGYSAYSPYHGYGYSGGYTHGF